jgi:hypothetical protein
MEHSPFYLSKHTFICLADNHYVFLDLRSDEYSCLDRTQSDILKRLLNGHRIVDDHSSNIRLHETADSASSAVVQTLLKKGLAVNRATDGKIPTLPFIAPPAASLMDVSDKPRPAINSGHVWHFFSAAAAASKNLRWGSIERTVRTVEDRKSACGNVLESCAITDLFEIFQTLRPYYPRPYLCLFDSLALLHFLARYDVFPLWVYGVTLEPFNAHCWIQAGDFVVNDTVDNVCNYTPIMSV